MAPEGIFTTKYRITRHIILYYSLQNMLLNSWLPDTRVLCYTISDHARLYPLRTPHVQISTGPELILEAPYWGSWEITIMRYISRILRNVPTLIFYWPVLDVARASSNTYQDCIVIYWLVGSVLVNRYRVCLL